MNCKLRALPHCRHSLPRSECMACRMACEQHENIIVYLVLPKGIPQRIREFSRSLRRLEYSLGVVHSGRISMCRPNTAKKYPLSHFWRQPSLWPSPVSSFIPPKSWHFNCPSAPCQVPPPSPLRRHRPSAGALHSSP